MGKENVRQKSPECLLVVRVGGIRRGCQLSQSRTYPIGSTGYEPCNLWRIWQVLASLNLPMRPSPKLLNETLRHSMTPSNSTPKMTQNGPQISLSTAKRCFLTAIKNLFSTGVGVGCREATSSPATGHRHARRPPSAGHRPPATVHRPGSKATYNNVYI